LVIRDERQLGQRFIRDIQRIRLFFKGVLARWYGYFSQDGKICDRPVKCYFALYIEK